MRETRQLPADLEQQLAKFRADEGRLVVLTGAGISAESDVPTFRGKEGYWVVGSREYHPQEMATHAMFTAQPGAVWAWYLYRRGVCHRAEPNAGHRAVVELERLLGERLLLITQNVDGLHLRAGSSLGRTFQVHGNIDFARCDAGCGEPNWRLPQELVKAERGTELSEHERQKLRCPRCEGWGRPHVLWFDECYDEAHFRFHSSIEAAVAAEILVVVGTSGATNLPMQVGQLALRNGAAIVDINPEPNPFSQMAQAAERGWHLQGPSGDFLPLFVEVLARAAGP